MISLLDPNTPIIDSDGRPTQAFAAFLLQVTYRSTIIGTGSPEGLLDGGLGQTYMDDTAASGSVLYIKQKTDIAGDRKKGWILV